MAALLTFVSILVISLIVVRVATVALSLTGLSADVARFQARSAWTGTGFTTGEAENVMKHPVRRKVVSILMVLRSAGLVTSISTLILSFVNVEGSGIGLQRLAILTTLLALLWLISISTFIDRQLTRAIRWALVRWTSLDTRDYASLLHLGGPYSVAEMNVAEGDWLCGRPLRELRLPDEGALVLAIERADNGFVGAPKKNAVIEAGDTVIIYARREILDELDTRPAGQTGQIEHDQSVADQRDIDSREGANDAEE